MGNQMTVKEKIIVILKKAEKKAKDNDIRSAIRDVRWDIEAKIKEK